MSMNCVLSDMERKTEEFFRIEDLSTKWVNVVPGIGSASALRLAEFGIHSVNILTNNIQEINDKLIT